MRTTASFLYSQRYLPTAIRLEAQNFFAQTLLPAHLILGPADRRLHTGKFLPLVWQLDPIPLITCSREWFLTSLSHFPKLEDNSATVFSDRYLLPLVPHPSYRAPSLSPASVATAAAAPQSGGRKPQDPPLSLEPQAPPGSLTPSMPTPLTVGDARLEVLIKWAACFGRLGFPIPPSRRAGSVEVSGLGPSKARFCG